MLYLSFNLWGQTGFVGTVGTASAFWPNQQRSALGDKFAELHLVAHHKAGLFVDTHNLRNNLPSFFYKYLITQIQGQSGL